MKRLRLLVPIVALVLALFAVGCSSGSSQLERAETWAYRKSVDPMTDSVMQIVVADAVSGEGKYGDPLCVTLLV